MAEQQKIDRALVTTAFEIDGVDFSRAGNGGAELPGMKDDREDEFTLVLEGLE